MSRFRLLLIGACVLLAGVGLAALWRNASPPAQPVVATAAAVGGPFALIDQDGRPVTEAVLKGKWSAVFFGFTYCPDVCPTTMQTLAQAKDRLGPKGRDLQVVFISVDPQRDTPAQLKSYLSSPAFPRPVIGLTGSQAQVAAATRAYRAYFEKDGDGADYVVNHTSAVYLMNPQGRFDRVLAYSLTPDEIARQVAQAMRG